MNDVITIGQLAQAADVPTSTIRYYEREGLLEPEGRTEGNYRFYGPHSLERLRFVKAAQALGFTLMDISMLLGFRDGKDDPCEEVQHIIEGRLDDLEKKILFLFDKLNVKDTKNHAQNSLASREEIPSLESELEYCR